LGSLRNAKKVGYDVGIEGLQYFIRIGVKHSDISGLAILPRTKFQQPGQF
jgi:hypothetical protein